MDSGQLKMNKWLTSVIVVLFAGVFWQSVSAQKKPITIFLAGDSTMAGKSPQRRPETGWGETLEQHFKTGTVKIENRAANGRSSKSFISEGLWQNVVKDVQKGDYVFIQFGHNDSSKEKGERYSPPELFKSNLAKFVDEVRAKGATPVLMTPVVRRRFDKDSKFYDSHGEYPDLTRAVAKEKKAALIDMQKMSEALVIKYGDEGSRKLFLQLKPGENPNFPNGIEDNTHFSTLGAEEMATLAVNALKKSSLKLRKLIR